VPANQIGRNVAGKRTENIDIASSNIQSYNPETSGFFEKLLEEQVPV
jgi:hypothetical protein